MHEAKQLHQAISGQSRIYLPRMLSSIAVTNEVRDTGVPWQHVFKLWSHACRKRCPTEWGQLSRLTPCRRRHWNAAAARGGEKFRGGLVSGGRHFQRTRARAYTHDCTIIADSSHGDSHVGSVSPAATRTRTLALTRTRTPTLTLLRIT